MLDLAEGRYEDCIESLTRVIEIDPASTHAYVIRGCAYGLSRRDDRGARAKQDFVTAGELAAGGTTGAI